MKSQQHLAIIGSGASAIYLLKHLLAAREPLAGSIGEISIFERSKVTGMGMPYSPHTTDRYNMSNISSEELPELVETFADWLRAQDDALLEKLDLRGREISEKEVYGRLALGQYLNAQYRAIIAQLAEAGIEIHEYPGCEIVDIADRAVEGRVILSTESGEVYDVDRVVIATGHSWAKSDAPERGYYSSPWPIAKLLPAEGGHHLFKVGTLGASLSAFDVITSLAHRHGEFVDRDGRLTFEPHPGTEEFGLAMHSVHGLLPHLQYEMEEPFREIYRHIDRDGLLAMVDERGYLRIATYFDEVCRPALIVAFGKDRNEELVDLLRQPAFGLEAFVGKMTDTHDYADAFEGLRFEMREATDSVENDHPVHWKEVIDDLIYTLNFHAELMPAEDHLTLQRTVMPFLMNVIAAMPLTSARTLLALREAGKLELISGKVSLPENLSAATTTQILVRNGDEEEEIEYRMFVDCSGQQPLELEDFPFAGMVESGTVRRARSLFIDPGQARESLREKDLPHLLEDEQGLAYHTGGIDIDAAYQVIGRDGQPNPRICDIAFPHTSGVRPYSYGLQACSSTSAIVVQAWVESVRSAEPVEGDLVDVSEIYEELKESEQSAV